MPEKLFYRTKHNYEPGIGREHNTEPSQTIPGETMTMKELLMRYSEGMRLDAKAISYFDQEDLEKIDRFYQPGALDLTDMEQLSQRITELQQSIERAQNRKKAEEEDQTEHELEQERDPETGQFTESEDD